MPDNKQEQPEVAAKIEAAAVKADQPTAIEAVKPETAKKSFRGKRRQTGGRREMHTDSEYEQKILDLARVTRVMAGGKRMRFRACIALGNKAGKVGIGLAKGADVTLAITKAVNQAKKHMIDVPLTDIASIPHEVKQKYGAALILLRPAKHGRGIICGGVVRIIAELAGIKNVTGKILGTNNNVTNAKCMMVALGNLKPLKAKKAIVNGASEPKTISAKDTKEPKIEEAV
jgi:small subunit ribosomal protein S5